ncbi:MAG TPA: DUF192 domain-containing protein [Candidatus Saccharimonadales bacterium]
MRRKPRRTWHLLIGLALVLAGGYIIYNQLKPIGSNLRIEDSIIRLDVADEPEEIIQGLSGRESLLGDEGMLFIFEQPNIPQFWMKDMLIPIDFVWISEDMKIVAITPSIGPDSYPIVFSPPSEVKYVLEVYAGVSAANGWLPGSDVEFSL